MEPNQGTYGSPNPSLLWNQIREPNQGTKSGNQIREPNQGTKSGNQIREGFGEP